MTETVASSIADQLGIAGLSKRAILLGLTVQVVATLIAAGILKLADVATSNLVAVLAVTSAVLFLLSAVLGFLLWASLSRSKEEKAETASLQMLEKWRDLESFTGLCEFEGDLMSSEESPREKLPDIETELFFMGNGGSKWTREKAEFDSMLRRTAENRGSVRFLLLDPTSDACREGSEVRFGNPTEQPRKIVESLCRLRAWDRMFRHLEVKLYSHVPHFRISLINKTHAVLGHYREYQNDSDETPLLVFSRQDCQWSFYSPFAGYFHHEWGNAEQINWPEIEDLADKYGVTHD
jgi:hypothetical protein